VGLIGLVTKGSEELPDLLFEYIETDDQPFDMNGKYSLKSLINTTDYFYTQNTIRFFMYDLLTGLDFLHSNGIMHRDIKTTNVMLSKEGFVKILDFDLAEFLTPTTSLKYTIGTPGYKAPESFLK
jgi:serine/threonine protein kinase